MAAKLKLEPLPITAAIVVIGGALWIALLKGIDGPFYFALSNVVIGLATLYYGQKLGLKKAAKALKNVVMPPNQPGNTSE